MSKSTILCLLMAISFIACKSKKYKTENLQNKLPNIIIMLADDLGYRDLSCYSGIPNTPNIDKLAQSGARFTQFYAAAPNCSPSRTGMLTGRSPFRNGMYSYRSEESMMHLRNEELTIAEHLKNKGYQTVHLGKWHLGCLPQDTVYNHPQPHDQGFDYSLGTQSNARPSHFNPTNFVRNGERLSMQAGYSCQILANEAVDWWETKYNPDKPFFMYFAFHEPHAKVAAPKKIVEKYSAYGNAATYMACIENMDSAVGCILNRLEKMGVAEKTLIVFASDNGSYRKGSNGELRALKSWLYEGGIRVPGIVAWPAKIGAGQVIDEPAGLVDIFPTINEITKLSIPENIEMDGTNILPLLNGESFYRKKALSWFFYRTSPEIAIRYGDLMIMGKDNDLTPRAHRFTVDDMEYINTMTLNEIEVYNVVEDTEQKFDMVDSVDIVAYKNMVDNKLDEIKENGYKWENLVLTGNAKKLKTDWKMYLP